MLEHKFKVLKVKSLSKQFPGVKALDNVSINLEAGKVHALMGENGAGKSTLIKILAGVFPKNSGQIFFDDGLHHVHFPFPHLITKARLSSFLSGNLGQLLIADKPSLPMLHVIWIVHFFNEFLPGHINYNFGSILHNWFGFALK